jgi:DNA-binding transcriptional regulator YiaG
MATTKPITRKVSGRVFFIDVPVSVDADTGELELAFADAQRAELAIASALAQEGPVDGASFQFMRGALGISARALSVLLDVSAETISRWENGVRDVDRAAWFALGDLVLEAAGKPTDARARMERIAEGQKPPKERRVSL